MCTDEQPMTLNEPNPISTSAQPCQVLRPDDLPSKNRGGGCRTVPLVTQPRGATAFLNGTTLFEPGAGIAHHSHNVVESVMVVQGDAIVDIDGHRTRLTTFDTTLVPANIPHHFENASDEAPMRIFWTYASVDATRTLADSGETSRIDGEAPGADAGAPVRGAAASVTEVVTLVAAEGAEQTLQEAVARAAAVFQRQKGARTFTLRQQVEDPRQFQLSIVWDTIEDHLEGFRSAPGFQEWRELVTPHLAQPPVSVHYRHALTGF